MLRAADELDADEIGAAIHRLKQVVSRRAVTLDESRGATITLSNFGALGGRHAVLVVVPPQVAIIGAGQIFERLELTDGQPHERLVLPLSLTFDHRVVTGGEAARFMNAMKYSLTAVTGKTDD